MDENDGKDAYETDFVMYFESNCTEGFGSSEVFYEKVAIGGESINVLEPLFGGSSAKENPPFPFSETRIITDLFREFQIISKAFHNLKNSVAVLILL